MTALHLFYSLRKKFIAVYVCRCVNLWYIEIACGSSQSNFPLASHSHSLQFHNPMIEFFVCSPLFTRSFSRFHLPTIHRVLSPPLSYSFIYSMTFITLLYRKYSKSHVSSAYSSSMLLSLCRSLRLSFDCRLALSTSLSLFLSTQ